MNNVIGIVGGMGSLATVSFFQQLLIHSPAVSDQAYMELLIHNNTRIPDRTQAILYDGSDPFPELVRSVRWLENGGATVIVLACITAHHYYDKLQESLAQATMFHIVKETADEICRTNPGLKKIGILATEGTIRTELWQNELRGRGIDAVLLSYPDQVNYFNQVVYGRSGIKAGYRNRSLTNKLLKGCSILMDMGAEAIIGGCSELPLVLSSKDMRVPYFDPLQIAAAKLNDLYYRRSP